MITIMRRKLSDLARGNGIFLFIADTMIWGGCLALIAIGGGASATQAAVAGGIFGLVFALHQP